jgi:hypothetical protein
MTEPDPVQREILLFGLDDWVGLWVVADFVRESLQTPTAEEVRQTAIQLLRPLVDGGYMEAGTLTSTGFEAWRDQGTAVDRIDGLWKRIGRDPNLADNVYLSNTTRGDAAARRWRS